MTSFLNDIFTDLKQKRLWPLALALVVALVAVPVVLSEPADETGAGETSSPAVTGGAGFPSPAAGLFQPIVSLGPGTETMRRSVARLGRKDPFVQQGVTSTDAGGLTTPSDAGTATDTGTGTETTTTPTTTDTGSDGTTGRGETTYFAYTADVRFGGVGKTDRKTLQQLRALPSSDNPVVVFMGVLTDGKTAVFLVSSAATARGDGKCKPDDDTCTFVYMKRDDVEFFEVADEVGAVTTYELELLRIGRKEIEPGESSKASRKSRSRKSDRSRSRARREKRRQRAARDRLLQVFKLVGF